MQRNWIGRSEGARITFPVTASPTRGADGVGIEIFTTRNAQLTKSGIDVDAMRDYYDMVTEAEARLLAGEEEPARALYLKAFLRFAVRKGDIAGSRTQANRSLAQMGLKPL